jgi:gliding motility-associated-like protein
LVLTKDKFMKKYFSIAVALLITSASFSQNTTLVKRKQLPTPPTSNSKIKQVVRKMVQPSVTNFGSPFVAKQKVNPLLSIGKISQFAAKKMVAKRAISNAGVVEIDPRDLKFSANGLLLSPDGFEIEFRTSGNPKVTDVCSTPRPYVIDPISKKNASCSFSVPCDDASNRDATSTSQKYFQLRWHVMTDGGASSNIDQATITAMMNTLNADFAAYDMIFCEDSARWVEDATNYTHDSGSEEVSLKTAYNQRPADLINIYVCGSMTAGGYARFPYDPMGGPNFRGGIVMNKSNCNATGHTLAHEMGHAFGLEHTFAGVDERTQCSDCYERVRDVASGSSNTSGVATPNGGPFLAEGDREGDWCSDTNPHNTNSYNCNTSASGTGVCDAGPWVNAPVNNHMSYSFCDSQFTEQQGRRMHCMANAYLSSWTSYGGGVCGTQPPVANFSGTPTTWGSPSNVEFTDLSAPESIIDTWTWDFNVAGQTGTVAPATFVGQTPPTVIYTLPGAAVACQDYEVSLTITSANGNDTETKTAYITVCPPAGDCDTLDADFNDAGPTVGTYSIGANGLFTGVPCEGSTNPADDPAGFYEMYSTPAAGTSIVGGISCILGGLADTDDDMTVQFSIYEDLAGFPDLAGGAIVQQAYSPAALGIGAGFGTFWIPIDSPTPITGVKFHVGVEMFPGAGDNDTLIMFPNANGEGDGNSMTNFTNTTGCGLEDYFDATGVYCAGAGYTASDVDFSIIPMMGEYAPMPVVTGYTQTGVCDTTYVTLNDTVLYHDYGNPSALVGMSYTFLSDGVTINSATPLGSIDRTYTVAGPDVLRITAVNDCGRSDTIFFTIPYNFLATPDAEFSKTQPNDVCIGDVIDFTANTAGSQDYNWDFGDGTVASSGSIEATTHTYTTAGTYYSSLTTTSTGCVGTQSKDDFVVVIDCSIEIPVADLEVSDSTGCAPLSITFTDNSTFVDPIDTWLWNFGDGTFYSTDGTPPAHVYNTPGTYFASLKVCNAGGCTTDNITIVIEDGVASDPTFTYDDFCADLGGVSGTPNTPGGTYSFNPDLLDGAVIDVNTGAISNAIGGTAYDVEYLTPGTTCNSSLTLTVIANGTPTISNLLATCNSTETDYAVSFDVADGTGGPYTVTENSPGGIGGTFTVNSWESNLISAGTAYDFDIADVNGCPVNVSGNKICVCVSDAGTMDTTPLDLCETEIANAIHNADHTLDSDDYIMYVLHTNNTTALGTVLDTNVVDPTFSFSSPLLTFGVQYYISTVVGDSLGNFVDFNDGCLQVTPGTPVIWSEEPDAGENDSTTTLCNSSGSTIDLNTLLTVSTGGVWVETTASTQFTPGTGVFDANGLSAGVYAFTYSVSGANCPDDISYFGVTVSAQESAGNDDLTGELCNSTGNTMDLNTLLVGNTATGVWSETSASGQFNTSTGVLTGDGLAAADYTFVYLMSNTLPCINDSANFTVTILSADAGENDSTTTLCNSSGSTIDLNTLLTVASAGSWAETTASTQFTPGTGVFDANGLAAGVYAFTYSVSGTNCPDDISYFGVTVSAQEVAGDDDLTAELCNATGSTIDLNTLLSGNTTTGAWSETSASGQFNTSTGVFNGANLTEGAYTFVYLISNTSPCTDESANFMVTVNDCSPVAGFTSSSTTVCRDGFLTFTDTSTESPTSYQWSFPGGTPATSTSADPGNIVYETLGTYQVSLVVTNASGTSQNTATETITVTNCDSAVAGITKDDADGEICENGCITFSYDNTLGGTPDSLIWTFQGISAPLDIVTTVDPTESVTACWVDGFMGTFFVSVSAKNAYNSGFSVAFDTITVHPNPILSAGNDVTINVGSDTMIQAQVTDASGNVIVSPLGNFSWSPTIYLSTPNGISSEVVLPEDTSTYTVSYVDENGCSASDSIIVNVNFVSSIGVPSAFTPLASTNNILFVKGKLSIKSLNFVIYNRYGQKVFESTDVDRGWDGTHKGKELNPGVFVYYVKATFKDGNTGELKGNVTLIK